MKMACDNGFGRVEIEQVTVQKKGGLHLPETGGMRAIRIGLCKQKPYEGKLIAYRTHTEVRGEYKGQLHTYVPTEEVLSIIELEPGEEAVPLFIVDENFGNTDGDWINASGPR